MKYQQGQSYEFEVKRIDRDSSGYEFFLVTDGEEHGRKAGEVFRAVLNCSKSVPLKAQALQGRASTSASVSQNQRASA